VQFGETLLSYPIDPLRADFALLGSVRHRKWLPGVIYVFQQGAPPDAVYTFKHALVQDAAYDSLLKARRQELHGKIARAIEVRFPSIGETEPELLAHHFTEAKQPESAIPLWQQAGRLGLQRMALTEAITHLNKGVALVAALPASAERGGMELDLRTLLGTAWMAFKGWPAQEVWDSLHPALALANSLRRNDALVPIIYGLFIQVLCRGRVDESLRWVAQAMDAAETYGDPNLLIVGHHAAVTAHFWLGRPIKVREHADRVLALYSEERHGHLVAILNCDPKTFSLVYSALSTRALGYPEQAVRIGEAAHANARRRGHPFDLGWALTVGAEVFDFLREPDEWLKRIEEGNRVGRENSLPFVTNRSVSICSGIALIRKGQIAEGMAPLERGLALWEEGGGRTNSPYYKSVLAEGMAELGDVEGALDLIDEVMAQIETPGWEERQYYAEALRIKGWLLQGKGDPAAAERAYIASLDWARTQQAKSWELRTATSYARLMRDQGQVGDAYDLLAPIYGWFTEGFDTKDLKEAKALLNELRSSYQ
jgi:predicted ATPase